MSIMIFFIAILIPIFIFFIFIPYWTRKTESFGVSIPESVYYTNELKKIRKQYAFVTGLLSLFIVAAFILLGMTFNDIENEMSILFTVTVILYLIFGFVIYLKFHYKMKQIKEKENWKQKMSQVITINTTFREQKLTYSNYWYMIPFLIALITAIISIKFYSRFPEQIPMNYDLAGNVTNWAKKSYRTIMFFPIMQVYMTLLFVFVNTIITKSKQQVNAENPEKSVTQNITFRRRWSLFMLVFGMAMILMLSMIQLSLIFTINKTILFIFPLVLTSGIIIGTIVLSFTTGQGGSRVGSSTDHAGDKINRDDDQYWKLGQFYFNKNDPSIFLEKRFGIGWTNNWAHPLSWVLLLAIISAGVGIPLLLTM